MRILAGNLLSFHEVCKSHNLDHNAVINVTGINDLSAADQDNVLYIASDYAERDNYKEILEHALKLGYQPRAVKMDIRLKKAYEEMMVKKAGIEQKLINDALLEGYDISNAAVESSTVFNKESGCFDIKARLIFIEFPHGVH